MSKQLEEVDEAFYADPDAESKAKTRFVSHYIWTYLRIISNTRNKIQQFSWRKIAYIDLFSGPGKYGTDQDSVPLLVLSHALGGEEPIKNIRFFFNDLAMADKLEENIKERFNYQSLPSNIKITKTDSTGLRVSSLFTPTEIVMSFVDSFSYLLCDVDTIKTLIRNPLSDCILYLNFSHFYRFIDYESEKPKFVNFFGSEENFEKVREMFHTTYDKDELAAKMVKNFILRLQKACGGVLHCLPIFFRKSREDTAITQMIMVVSKNPKGPKTVRSQFCEEDDKDSEKTGKTNEDFFLENGKLTVYEDSHWANVSLFEDQERMEKYEYPMSFIPDEKANAITREELLERIDKDFVRKNGFMSGYSETYLNHMLSRLENQDLVNVEYDPTARNKRRLNTWSEKTRFYLAKGETSDERNNA